MIPVAVALAAGSAAAQTAPPAEMPNSTSAQAKTYADCMSVARTDPKKGIGLAQSWARQGGDEGARHCLAVALLNDGEYAEAARQLESLAATTQRPGKRIRIGLLAQAGQAWLIAGDTERALAVQTRVLDLAGPEVEFLLDRAITRASTGDYWMAIDDLNDAVDRDPRHVGALVLRATAWRKLKNLELAGDDISRALADAPNQIDALLERGNIRALSGDIAGAAADWRKVVELEAASPAADSARRNLEKLKLP